MRINDLYCPSIFIIVFFLGSSLSCAQETQEIVPSSIDILCQDLRSLGGTSREESLNVLRSSARNISRGELEKVINQALIDHTLEQENSTCIPSSLIDTVVREFYPPASQISIFNESVNVILEALSDKEGSIEKLSSLYDSLNYPLKSVDLPKAKVLEKISSFLNVKLADVNLDLRYRFYAYLFLSSEYFLTDESCPTFELLDRQRFNLDLGDRKFSKVDVRSQCLPMATENAIITLKKIAEVGDLESIHESLDFFHQMYPSELDTRQIDLVLLKYSLSSRSEIRPLVFPLISTDLISALSMKEKLQLLFLGQLPIFFYYFIAASLALPIVVYVIILLYLSFETVPKRGYRKHLTMGVLKVDEYSSLLEAFGLDDSASEADIKRAYREFAKKYHPDTATRKSREEFEKVQRSYERLMKLGKGWFGFSR